MDEPVNLDRLLTAVTDGAVARGLTVYDALLILPIEEDGQMAYPWAEWEGDYTHFLDMAATVGARIVYVAGTHFDYDGALREEVATAGYRLLADDSDEAEPVSDPPTDPATWLLHRLRERTEAWAAHDGELDLLQCVWMKDGVAHGFRPRADWLTAYRTALDEAVADAEAVQAEDRQLRSAEDASQLQRLAKQMARHPRFPEATSETKRAFMAEQLYPDADPLDCRRIAALAALIYWWEIEPVERVSKAQRVRDLYDAGETVTNIAAILRTSRDKVKALLAETANG